MRIPRLTIKRAAAAPRPLPRGSDGPMQAHVPTPPARVYSLWLGPGYARR